MVRLSRNSRPQTQIGIRMGICMLWRQGFIPCHGGYPIPEMIVKLGGRRLGQFGFQHSCCGILTRGMMTLLWVLRQETARSQPVLLVASEGDSLSRIPIRGK